MTTFKTLLAISAVTVALAAPAAAQGGFFIPHGSLLMVDGSGKVTMTEAGKMAQSMMRRSGRPVAGAILYMDGGRLYSMADKKMAGGKMLSTMFLEDFQTASNRGAVETRDCSSPSTCLAFLAIFQ